MFENIIELAKIIANANPIVLMAVLSIVSCLSICWVAACFASILKKKE